MEVLTYIAEMSTTGDTKKYETVKKTRIYLQKHQSYSVAHQVICINLHNVREKLLAFIIIHKKPKAFGIRF